MGGQSLFEEREDGDKIEEFMNYMVHNESKIRIRSEIGRQNSERERCRNP